MQTGPDDGSWTKDRESIIDKAAKSVPKGISAKDAQTIKDVKDGKK